MPQPTANATAGSYAVTVSFGAQTGAIAADQPAGHAADAGDFDDGLEGWPAATHEKRRISRAFSEPARQANIVIDVCTPVPILRSATAPG